MLAVKRMISNHYEKLSFHDAFIKSIERSEGVVNIVVEGAFLSEEHPSSGGENWFIEEGILKLTGVEKESAAFWNDEKEAQPHPEPEFPLDEIMNSSFNGEVFSFDGFLKTEPWYEWSVYGSGFEFIVLKKSPWKNS
jgi:hypothetical protein